MRILVILFFILTLQRSYGQYDYQYSYSGYPGAIIIDSIPTVPNSNYIIDFCTQLVPDRLTIYTDKDSIQFYIGGQLSTNRSKSEYHGYAEFRYVDSLMVIKTDSEDSPSSTRCDGTPSGLMRLYYTSKTCWLKFKITGNIKYPTVFDLQITKTFVGGYVTKDTLYEVWCGKKLPYFYFVNCEQYLIIPIDSSIQTWVTVTHPDCSGDFGSIEFDRYPQYNLYNATSGQYKIKIDNGICHKTFAIELQPRRLCRWYVPNAFSPNGDGTNDVFLMFTPTTVKYDLFIYDRWGNLIFQKYNLNTNIDGWNPDINIPNGVYVWYINCMDLSLTGDITLIR